MYALLEGCRSPEGLPVDNRPVQELHARVRLQDLRALAGVRDCISGVSHQTWAASAAFTLLHGRVDLGFRITQFRSGLIIPFRPVTCRFSHSHAVPENNKNSTKIGGIKKNQTERPLATQTNHPPSTLLADCFIRSTVTCHNADMVSRDPMNRNISRVC